MLFIGPISSIFDYTTFFVMLYVFGCWDPARASLFQTGWFVESLITQTLIVHVIRTNEDAVHPGPRELATHDDHRHVMALAAWLPYSPLAPRRSASRPCRRSTGRSCSLTLLSYVVLTQAVKTWLIRKAWI